MTGSKGGSTLEAIAWGGGYHGQLGVRLKGDKGEASKKTINTDVKITFPDDEEPRHVACGGSFSAVVTSSGKVYTWGMGKEGQLGYKLTVVSGQQPEPLQVTGELSSVQVMAIACGREHTLVLSFGGDMYSWGSNKYGQLGHGDHHNQLEPHKLEVEGGLSFSHIATGDQHSAALCDGKLYTWGNNAYGQLGHGDPPKRTPKELKELSPKLVEHMVDTVCSWITCGSTQTSVITSQGHVYVCGSVERYAAAEGTQKPVVTDQFLYTPVRLEMPPKVDPIQQVACGKSHMLLLTTDGDVYAVGAGKHCQLGHGKTSDLNTPRLILQGKKVFHVAAGRYHSVAITAHGSMFTWGSGEHGQLCHGVDGGEPIPRVVDSLLHRALLKAACGEHHTIALCTAPLEGSENTLSADMVVWKFHEHEEYEMKKAIAKSQSSGVTKKHLQQVQNMVRELISQYEDVMGVSSPEAGDGGDRRAGATGEDAGERRAATGDDALPFKEVTDKISAMVNSSKHAFDVWQTFADGIDRGGAAEQPHPRSKSKPSERKDGVVPLPPIVTPRAPKPTNTRLKPHPPPADREKGPAEHISRADMYGKLGELQAAVRKSVADVVKDDPSRGIEKMERELIALRDVYSGMEAQRRLRAEETEQLRTEFRGLDGATAEDDVRSLLERADALKVQLQAVRLRYEEAKENREVFEIVIQQLKTELNDQSHRIADLHTFQRDHDLLLERMVARKDAALEQMVETQKEGKRVEAESKQLRESLNEHLGGVRKLVQYMERTVSYVTKAAEDREAKELEKQKKKIAKLQYKLDQTKERQSEIRKTAAGAAFALGTWLEKKFATITDATGYCVADVDTIVDKIATRDEVMAEMHASREEKKRRLKELATQKKVVEQELIDIRAQFFNERPLRQVDTTRNQLEKALSKSAKPMEKWLESTSTLASFHQLALTSIQKVDYVKHAGQETPHSAELERVRNLDDISLWKPTGNIEKNTVFYLELLSELAQRLELLNSVPDDDEENDMLEDEQDGSPSDEGEDVEQEEEDGLEV